MYQIIFMVEVINKYYNKQNIIGKILNIQDKHTFQPNIIHYI